jgi:hypothetical protein
MPSTLLITNEQKQLLNLQQLIMDSASRPMIQKAAIPTILKQYRKTYIDSSNTALEIIEAAGVQNHLPPLQMKNMIIYF